MISAKLAYLLLLLLLAVFSVAYLDTVPILMIYALLLITVVTAGWSFFARKRIQLLFSADSAGEDRRIQYHITVKNASFFPVTFCEASFCCVNLFDERAVKLKTRFTVPARGVQELTGFLQTDSAGVYELSCTKCFFTDWFRLFRRKLKPPAPLRFSVWPVCHPLHMELVTIPDEDFSSTKNSSDRVNSIPGDFFGVRAYREGDRIQHIHWKLTGKSDQFVVKEFSLPEKNSISLVLEFSGAQDISLKNALLDTAVSLSGFFLEHSVDHELCFIADGHLSRYEIKEQSQLYHSLRELLSHPPDMSESQPALLASQHPAANKHLLCVACDETAAENPALLEQPLSAALLQISRDENREPSFLNRLHLVPVDAADVQKSLTGLEL